MKTGRPPGPPRTELHRKIEQALLSGVRVNKIIYDFQVSQQTVYTVRSKLLRDLPLLGRLLKPVQKD